MDESTASRPARRRLTPGLTAFLVIDVLLVLAVLVGLAAYLSGGDQDPSGGTEATSTAPADPGGDAGDGSASPTTEPLDTFATPSGNIACEITGEAATCTIAESAAEPVDLEDCAGTAGQVVTVTAQGASTPCVTGALPGSAAPGTPILDYGEETTVGDFTCASATSGVTCRHDPTGAGFSLARAGHQLLDPTG